jgi:hypothetical protein
MLSAMYPQTFSKLKELRSHVQKRLRTRPEPETLYHYTDGEGLLGIITSGTMWATHSAYLNDASEFQYAVRLLKDVIMKTTAEAEPDTWEALCRDYFALSDVEQEHQSPERTQSFVACFSEERDRLSQWRGYGKSIGGYGLGLPFKHLDALERRINDSQVRKDFDDLRITVRLGPCEYQPDVQMELLKGAFNEILGSLKEKRPAPDTRVDPDPMKRLFDASEWLPGVLNAIARMWSPWFKDPAFKDEWEWRLVVEVRRANRPDGHPTPDDIRNLASVMYRKGEYSLIPYIVLSLVLDAELTLSQVVVGPTPLPENALAAAIQFLRPKPERIPAPADQKIVCESKNVVNSQIPFRRV